MVFRVVVLSLLLALATANPHLESLANAISESFKVSTFQVTSHSVLEKLVSGKHMDKNVFDLLKNTTGSGSQLSVEVGFVGLVGVRVGLRGQKTVNVNITNVHGGAAALLVADQKSGFGIQKQEMEVREMVNKLHYDYITQKADIIDAKADVLVGRFGRVNLTATAGTKSEKGVIDGGFIAASRTKVVAN